MTIEMIATIVHLVDTGLSSNKPHDDIIAALVKAGVKPDEAAETFEAVKTAWEQGFQGHPEDHTTDALAATASSAGSRARDKAIAKGDVVVEPPAGLFARGFKWVLAAIAAATVIAFIKVFVLY